MRKPTLLLALAAVSLTLPACDAFGGDADVIGGTYSTSTEDFGVYSVIIPEGTESDADATFSSTQTENAGTYTFTGTYDHPSLRLDFGDEDVVPCTVSSDYDSLQCTIQGSSYTLTR